MTQRPNGSSETELWTARATYRLETVTTQKDQEKGLSYRDRMASDKGMLFAFVAEDDRCFWMKDMRFSIDIIWLDSEKRITHIEPKLSPTTYPRGYCARGQYVIELNSGEATKNGFHEGDTLNF